MFKDQTILITGGTGSWGNQLTTALLAYEPREIRILSRNEFAQVQMQRRFQGNKSLKFIIGDVRDFDAINDACRNVDYVFHLAALKHVPICEDQPLETLKTNVVGTQNIIRASIANRVKKVIDVSTDKAVEPVNFYGMSKALGEKLILQANQLSRDTRFACVRGGNVLGSNGSVVPLFISQLKSGPRISITSFQMTRFFLTLQNAINLLLQAAAVAIGGEIFVLKMASCKITDLAMVLAAHYSADPVELVETGIRPGEKLHEVLVSRYEAPTTVQFSDEYYVILPTYPSPELIDAYQSYAPFGQVCYESSTNLMSTPDLRRILQDGGFLQ